LPFLEVLMVWLAIPMAFAKAGGISVYAIGVLFSAFAMIRLAGSAHFAGSPMP